MLVSPILNDFLVLAEVQPDAFLSGYAREVAKNGCWSSRVDPAFASLSRIVVRATAFGLGIAAEVSIDRFVNCSQWDANTMLVTAQVRLPETVKQSLEGKPLSAVFGTPLLIRPAFVIKSQTWSKAEDRLILLCDAPLEPM